MYANKIFNINLLDKDNSKGSMQSFNYTRFISTQIAFDKIYTIKLNKKKKQE